MRGPILSWAEEPLFFPCRKTQNSQELRAATELHPSCCKEMTMDRRAKPDGIAPRPLSLPPRGAGWLSLGVRWRGAQAPRRTAYAVGVLCRLGLQPPCVAVSRCASAACRGGGSSHAAAVSHAG